MENLTHVELETLIRVKKMVCSVPNKTEPFLKLAQHLENVCRVNCEHRWVRDLIDICPDNSTYITYCEVCDCTL